MTAPKKFAPNYLKLADVAEATGCSIRHIQEEIKRGNIRAYKPGKCLLFDPVDVEKWIKRKAV